MYSNILFWNICCFQVCLFFIKEMVVLRYLLPSKTLIIQIFNLSIQVSLSPKLIVQITLALIYGTLFNSVQPLYVISQPTTVANTYIIKSLFSDERTRKITSTANCIPSICLKFASGCFESSLTQWIEYTYRVFSVCYKAFLGVLKVATNNIYRHTAEDN